MPALTMLSLLPSPALPLHLCRNHSSHPIETSRGSAHLLFMYGDLRADAGYVDLMIMLASLIELRTCPLHLHFAVDHNLETLLNSSLRDIPYLKYSYYDDSAIIEAQRTLEPELPSQDIAFKKELRKASPELLPLPPEANKVLMVDFDIMFIRDICSPFFELAKGLENAAAFLSPDASSLYTRSKRQAAYLMPHEYKWQPSYVGFHSGVVMLNIEQMRASNWTAKYMESLFSPSRSINVFLNNKDQAIYNMMRRETNPPIVLFMSPSMNFQMYSKEWRQTFAANFWSKSITIMHGSRGTFRRENVILGRLRDLFFFENGGVESKELCHSMRTNISFLVFESVTNFLSNNS